MTICGLYISPHTPVAEAIGIFTNNGRLRLVHAHIHRFLLAVSVVNEGNVIGNTGTPHAASVTHLIHSDKLHRIFIALHPAALTDSVLGILVKHSGTHVGGLPVKNQTAVLRQPVLIKQPYIWPDRTLLRMFGHQNRLFRIRNMQHRPAVALLFLRLVIQIKAHSQIEHIARRMQIIIVDGTFKPVVSNAYRQSVLMAADSGLRIVPRLVIIPQPLIFSLAEITDVGCPYRTSLIVLASHIVDRSPTTLGKSSESINHQISSGIMTRGNVINHHCSSIVSHTGTVVILYSPYILRPYGSYLCGSRLDAVDAEHYLTPTPDLDTIGQRIYRDARQL